MTVIDPQTDVMSHTFAIRFGKDQGAFAHDIVVYELTGVPGAVAPEIGSIAMIFAVFPHAEVDFIIGF